MIRNSARQAWRWQSRSALEITCGSVTIGDDSVIGAGSVVTKDIPAGVVAFGVPCRVMREITDADRYRYPIYQPQ